MYNPALSYDDCDEIVADPVLYKEESATLKPNRNLWEESEGSKEFYNRLSEDIILNILRDTKLASFLFCSIEVSTLEEHDDVYYFDAVIKVLSLLNILVLFAVAGSFVLKFVKYLVVNDVAAATTSFVMLIITFGCFSIVGTILNMKSAK